MPDNFKYTAGLNHVGSYQASTRPFVLTEIVGDVQDLQNDIA